MARRACPRCGTKREKILDGDAGCPECFKVFRGEVVAYLEAMFGATRYVGEPYIRDPDAKRILMEIQEMEADMRMAVQEENYERAARLRDSIEGIRKRLGLE